MTSAPTHVTRRVAWANLFARAAEFQDTGKLALTHATHPYPSLQPCRSTSAPSQIARSLTVAARFLLAVIVLSFPLIERASAEPRSKVKRGDWPMWGGSTDRNMVSGERGISTTWDVKTKKNIKWIAPLGSDLWQPGDRGREDSRRHEQQREPSARHYGGQRGDRLPR